MLVGTRHTSGHYDVSRLANHDALNLMKREHPACASGQDGHMVGIVSYKDLLMSGLPATSPCLGIELLQKITIKEVMTGRPERQRDTPG
jgi:hypothetical protein